MLLIIFISVYIPIKYKFVAKTTGHKNMCHNWPTAKTMKTGIWQAPHYWWEPHWHIFTLILIPE